MDQTGDLEQLGHQVSSFRRCAHDMCCTRVDASANNPTFHFATLRISQIHTLGATAAQH
ncbi:Uncharacterised protein [Mycobacteroides abscessus subsp. abscessus]|nr:Uncharacterised protein [Mycobacteroides abscessus subsp. abscessus]